jgi:small subunit ribosomal protein S16
MVVIRLTRVGKKNSPAYRVVVADRRRAVKRKFIEILGHYNPISKPKEIVINKDRALFWMSQGAVPSDTVRNLMADLGILKKSEKVNKVYGKEKKKKEAKEGAEKPAVTTKPESEETAADESEVAAETVMGADAKQAGAETIAEPEEVTAEETPSGDTPAEETKE